MSARAQDPRSSAPARRLVGIAISLALHGLVFAIAALYPPAPERVEPISWWSDVELLEFEAWPVPAPAPRAPDRAEQPEPEPASEEPSAPATAEPQQPREPSASGRRGDDDAVSDEPTSEPSADPPDSSRALALGGLRRHSESDRVSAVVPRPQREQLTGTDIGVGGSGRRPGPRRAFGTAPRPASDGKPRSLAEAGFDKRRKDGSVRYRDPKRRFSAFIHPDGSMTFRDLPGKLSALPGGAELARKGSGQELYLKEKKQLLADTFELRMQLAIAYAERQLQRRLAALEDELARLWSDETMSAQERRRRLFKRWDECTEGPGEVAASDEFAEAGGIDAVRRSAGGKARAIIEAFIRRYLPKGSEDCFSEAELERLNADRESRQEFAPYARG